MKAGWDIIDRTGELDIGVYPSISLKRSYQEEYGRKLCCATRTAYKTYTIMHILTKQKACEHMANTINNVNGTYEYYIDEKGKNVRIIHTIEYWIRSTWWSIGKTPDITCIVSRKLAKLWFLVCNRLATPPNRLPILPRDIIIYIMEWIVNTHSCIIDPTRTIRYEYDPTHKHKKPVPRHGFKGI